MNKKLEKYVKSIQELQSSGRFSLSLEHSGDGFINDIEHVKTLFYNDKTCTVIMKIYPYSTEETIANDIAKAYTMVDKAEKEYYHAINHPDFTKALMNYLMLNK